jgi:hypothetical protein
VPLVLAFLRDMGKRGVPDAMRPLFVNLTAPTNAEERAVRGALDVWVDMVAGSGRGAGVLLAEGRGERQGTRHWHGLALTTVPERALTTAYLPLGSPEMERDIRRVLAYALRQHAGSEIVVRGGLADCWRRAGAVAPVSVVPPSTTGPVEPTGEPGEKPPARASAKRAARGAAGGARTCAYCGESLEGLRRDARYCSRSCRNMASRKNVRSKGKAA